eukprot:755877-Hanusia_phi.AAC.1
MFDYCAALLFYVLPCSIFAASPVLSSPNLASASSFTLCSLLNHGAAFSKQPTMAKSIFTSDDSSAFASTQNSPTLILPRVQTNTPNSDIIQQQWKGPRSGRKNGRRLQRTCSKMMELNKVAETQSTCMDYWPTKASLVGLHDCNRFKSSASYTMLQAKLYPHIEF